MITEAATAPELTRTHTNAVALEPARPQREPSLILLCLTLTVIIGGIIRLFGLSARSLWFDEAFTWRLIDYPWLEMLDRATRDNSPPFYYFLLKGWSEVFGASPVALRSLSLLFGLSTIAGVYAFCVEAFGRTCSAAAESAAEDNLLRRARGVGLLAAALVAVSALQVRYSQEVPCARGRGGASGRCTRCWLLFWPTRIITASTCWRARQSSPSASCWPRRIGAWLRSCAAQQHGTP